MKPISKTAFYTCGARMLDAEAEDPICGDVYAEYFMNSDGRRILEDFRDETSPNASTVVRHRIIDDLLRLELSEQPDLRVVLIGAGFDSRAFRLNGGTWLEIDEPSVIEYKNERLPAEDCQSKLRRAALDFSTGSLAEKLSAFSDDSPVVVVVEGVFMYLDEEAIKQTLRILRRVFPSHKLIGDLMNRQFFEEYGKTLHEKLNGLGASFKFTVDDPEKIFLESGYQRREKISIIGTAVKLKLLEIPEIALEAVLLNLRDGNAVYIFET